jgi:hypothetical protein
MITIENTLNREIDKPLPNVLNKTAMRPISCNKMKREGKENKSLNLQP